MATGSCRKCGLRPRRVRRGSVEPLCDECYGEAIGKVARELAEEAAIDGRTRFRRMRLGRGARPTERAPERVAPVKRAGASALGNAVRRHQHTRDHVPATGRRPRCISEEVLREARRLYGVGLSLRGVAETLLDETEYANAHSAEVALRSQFKRRGWPLRTRAQARARRA